MNREKTPKTDPLLDSRMGLRLVTVWISLPLLFGIWIASALIPPLEKYAKLLSGVVAVGAVIVTHLMKSSLKPR